MAVLSVSLYEFMTLCQTGRRSTARIDQDNDSEWDGLGSSKGKGKAEEAEEEEYEGEEQLATVTVVEEFDPDSLIHGPSRKSQDEEDELAVTSSSSQSQPHAPIVGDTAVKKAQIKAASKAKTVKYQTNAARKTDRHKQRNRKLEKAERAGAKSSKRKGSRGKR